MTRPLFRILVSMVLGILSAEHVHAWPGLFFILIPLTLCSVLWVSRTFQSEIILLLVFFQVGFLAHTGLTSRLSEEHLLRQVSSHTKDRLIGRVISFPEEFPDKVRLLLGVESCNGKRAWGKVLVSVYFPPGAGQEGGDRGGMEYGDRLEIVGRFRSPGRLKNPGGFDYGAFLKRKGIRVVGSVSSRHITLLDRGCGSPCPTRLCRLRKDFHAFLDRSLPAGESGVLKALVTGDRSGISPETRERFAQAGASHLLAVSGLHMGFVALMSYQFFRILLGLAIPIGVLRRSWFCWVPSRLASAATLFLIPVYTVFVGGRTSSLRAAIMIGLFLVSKIIERERDPIQPLMVAALIILFWNPASLFEADFQLSFAAVTAMVLYARHLTEAKLLERQAGPMESASTPGFLKTCLGKLTLLVTVTVIAALATAPITAALFHRVSAVGILANLICVPLTGFWVVPWGLICLVAFLISPSLALWPAELARAGVSVLEGSVSLFSSWSMASSWVLAPSPLVIFLFYFVFVIFLLLRGLAPARRLAAMVALGLVLFAANEWAARVKGDGCLHMRFLDVGQGASTLLVLPDAKIVLIDGGGFSQSPFDMGRRVLLPALLAQGIRSIDIMVLTHPHPDHLGGLIGLLEEVPVGEVWDSWERYPSEQYRRFRTLIGERGIRRRYLDPGGEEIRVSGILFEVLRHGPGKSGGSSSEVNNGSLVMKVSYGETSLLVTGDLEAQGESVLLKARGEDLKSTILQVSHHGSLSSSSWQFVDRVQPSIAVIQVGGGNPFGFPSKKVLGRYAYVYPNTALFRTDRDGAVWIRTDGQRIEVSTFGFQGN